MTCKDCPEPDRQNGKGGLVVYTGGSPEQHLTAMRYTLPEDFDRVEFLADGSIRYKPGDWEPPKPIEGYEQDRHNPLLFRPLWLPCQMRLYGTSISDGCNCLQIHAMCSHPQVKLDGNIRVSFERCKRCYQRVPIKMKSVPRRTPLPQ